MNVHSEPRIMVSLGPLLWNSVEYFKNGKTNYDEAKKQAVFEFLQYNLNYSTGELEELEITDTRMSSKDEVINIAFVNEDNIRELYSRKAESRNDNIILRCYVPPNFHERLMALSRVCTDKRKNDSTLKTQLRFGKHDVEILVKTKGEDGGFKKVDLDEFTDMNLIPKFNHLIKWRKYNDKPPCRPANHWEDLGPRPSTMNQAHKADMNPITRNPNRGKGIPSDNISSPTTGNDNLPPPPMKRANSNSVTNAKNKQKHLSAASSDDEMTGNVNDQDEDINTY